MNAEQIMGIVYILVIFAPIYGVYSYRTRNCISKWTRANIEKYKIIDEKKLLQLQLRFVYINILMLFIVAIIGGFCAKYWAGNNWTLMFYFCPLGFHIINWLLIIVAEKYGYIRIKESRK